MAKVIASKSGSESRILSVGSYRPKRLVPNSEIVDRIESSDEWIQQRTGIESRRFADDSESVLEMATWAVEDALAKAKLSISDVDTLIVATVTFPFQMPSAATAILQRLGHPTAAAFDINAACAGFSYGISMAHDFIKAGTSNIVLVVGAEKISDFTDPDDRATAFIFADGAGAVVIGQSREAGIGPVEWGSDADNRDAIQMNPSWIDVRDVETQLTKAGSKWPNISQEGQKVYRWAVFSMSKAAVKALEVWLPLRSQALGMMDQSVAGLSDAALALFPGRYGTRLTAQSVWQRLKRRSLLAGLATPVHPHMLRHSFASHVLQSSSDLRAVQELLGHANISTTQVYTRLDFQHLAKAYDAAHPRAKRGSGRGGSK
jgi:3-oxoacyl-[acyl-carrier-protein] synthase-3